MATSPATKRAMDLIVGLPLALLATPLMLVLALGSFVAYRSNPFFTQRRLGLHGRSFTCVKIRSLPVSAPSDVDKYALRHVDNNSWGRLLRRFHLDELPQLWHVVFGSMSLVGPRPEMPSLATTFDRRFLVERSKLRPGCTGLWQVSMASGGLINEAPEFDLHYVRTRTLRLDAWLLWRTAREIVAGSSLTSVADIPTWTGAAPVAPVAQVIGERDMTAGGALDGGDRNPIDFRSLPLRGTAEAFVGADGDVA